MALYQFILTPLDKFYFGKEKHPVRPSYYMESNPFPQQTGILGLIRHYLLLSTGKIDKKDDWDDLIGKESFDGSLTQTFGKINKVYPLFIFKEDVNKVLLPFKELGNLINANSSNVKVSYNNKGFSDLNTINSVANSLKITEQLNVKEHFFNDCFIPSDYSDTVPMHSEQVDFSPVNFFGQKTKKLDTGKGIFIKHIQPGILKNYSAISKEDSYFKIQYYKLNQSYHFSFLSDIDEELDTSKNIFMTFGGEASPYKVSLKKDDIPNIDLFSSHNTNNSIFHFISDTIINKAAFQNVLQFIGSTQYFRSMKTDPKNNLSALYNLNRNDPTLFSDSKLLIKKGSIAFIKQDKSAEFIETINVATSNAYKNIGYNYFKQLNTLRYE